MWKTAVIIFAYYFARSVTIFSLFLFVYNSKGVISVSAQHPRVQDNEQFAEFAEVVEDYKHKAPWDVPPYNNTRTLKNVSNFKGRSKQKAQGV